MVKLLYYSDLIRMIEERVGPIIERGDILFNNLRNIQRRRMIRTATSAQVNQEQVIMQNYQDLLNYEESLLQRANTGYSQNMINRIRQVKFNELTTEDKRNLSHDATCSICCDNYNETDHVKVLDCAHLYHTRCITEWLKRNKKCPLCKKQAITPDV